MYTYIFSFSFIIYILLYCLAAIYFSRRCIKDTESNWYRLLFFNKFKVTPLLCIPNDLYYHSSSNGILKLILIACWHKYNRFYFLFCFLGMHMSTEIDLKKKKKNTTLCSAGYVIWHRASRILSLCCSVAKSCPTLWDPLNCSPPGSSPWDFSSKNTGVGYHFLLQWIFLTERFNTCLLHCRQILKVRIILSLL